jgi:hypothetical protein
VIINVRGISVVGTRVKIGGGEARSIFDNKQRTLLLSGQTFCFVFLWSWGQMSMRKSAILPEFLCCFPKFLNAYARILHQIMPRFVPITSFPG